MRVQRLEGSQVGWDVMRERVEEEGLVVGRGE